MESIEASLSVEECTRKACQKSRRKGRIDDGEAKFSSVRHDNPSVERQPREDEISEKGENYGEKSKSSVLYNFIVFSVDSRRRSN